MAKYLRIAAVNFEATVFDTENLSTIRGASMALLKIPEIVLKEIKGGEIIYAAASEGLAKIESKESLEDIEKKADKLLNNKKNELEIHEDLSPLLKHLSFVSSAIEGDETDFNLIMQKLEKRAAYRRYSQCTTKLPEMSGSSGNNPCEIDKVRPRAKEPDVGEKKHVSQSVFDRRKYGRTSRDAFYLNLLTDQEWLEKYSFSSSFKEIIASAPSDLPPSVQNKMAVIYLDGNKFGEHRGCIWKDKGEKGAKKFAKDIADKRNIFLADLLRFVRDAQCFTEGNEKILQFETLMWGGDEMLFVLPAWMAFETIAAMGKSLSEGWDYGDKTLTHAAGLLICNYKTPIREAKRVAKALAEETKVVTHREVSAFQYMILEGIDPPHDSPGEYKKRLLGKNYPEADTLLLSAEEESPTLDTMIENLCAWKAGNPRLPPRTMFYRLFNYILKEQYTRMKLSDVRSQTLKENFDAKGFTDFFSKILPGVPAYDAQSFPFYTLYHYLLIWDYLGHCNAEEKSK